MWILTAILLQLAAAAVGSSSTNLLTSVTSDEDWTDNQDLLARQLISTCSVTVSATQSCFDNTYVSVKLFTSTSPTIGENLNLNLSNIAATSFNAANPTKFIIHGWKSSPTLDRFVSLKTAYLTRGAYNVIAVDWSTIAAGEGYNCYPNAINNARHTGKCIAYQIQKLREKGVEDMHVVGISLGAQVASFVADHLRPYRLPRITALDAALPLFHNSDRNAQLDKGDAVFVDAVHTNMFNQGQHKQIGHVDFYMNDGSNQPGCGSNATCSHIRSIAFFTESVNSKVGFWGSKCRGYLEFLFGRCAVDSPSVLMGEDVDKYARGFYHVITRGSSPYAIGQWQIFY